jgi:hypothetical protein
MIHFVRNTLKLTAAAEFVGMEKKQEITRSCLLPRCLRRMGRGPNDRFDASVCSSGLHLPVEDRNWDVVANLET